MEQQQRSLAFTAAVGLIILAIIVGSVYYLVKFIQGRVASTRQAPQASVETVAQASGSPEGGSVQGEQIPGGQAETIPQTPIAPGQTGNPPADKKFYNAGNFQIVYPKNWGILNCTNSLHFELDPLSGSDSKIKCESAVKPITVLVDNILGCEGESIKIGIMGAVKSKKVEGGYTVYRWCTKTKPVLNITHRVSKGGEKAVSPDDYSAQIEEIISKLTFSRGS